MQVLKTVAALKAWRKEAGGRVGFVPTMGALHDGHAALLRDIRPRCDHSVLSIFVNPAQFGPKEDLAKYPRTLERDLEVARACGVDAVFAPESPGEIYPPGFSTYVEETQLSLGLCGKFRPGHFRGVTTVVLKLFNLVRPEFALFGLKDSQQFFVLHRMARDLDLDVRVEAMTTVREQSGLALSSRNVYLSREAHRNASRIHAVLSSSRDELERGESVEAVLARGRGELSEAGFELQYLDLVALPGLEPVVQPLRRGEPALLAVAAFLDGTRLIDNVIIHPEALEARGITIRNG